MTNKGHVKEADMFMWNYFLQSHAEELSTDWVLPIIHGFVDQASTNYGFNVRNFNIFSQYICYADWKAL